MGNGYRALANYMVSKESTLIEGLPQGYTYLSQMIVHDIVKQTTVLPGDRRNVRRKLQLDSVYVGRVANDGKYILLGKDGDLFRDPDSAEAVIPEPRNDENTIVSQMHALWNRIHNSLLLNDIAGNFSEAKNQTIALFQLVVVTDFMRRLLLKDVYEDIFFNKVDVLPVDELLEASFFTYSSCAHCRYIYWNINNWHSGFNGWWTRKVCI